MGVQGRCSERDKDTPNINTSVNMEESPGSEVPVFLKKGSSLSSRQSKQAVYVRRKHAAS